MRHEEVDPLAARRADWLLAVAVLAGWVVLHVALASAIWVGLVF